jgi:hypothetical protein
MGRGGSFAAFVLLFFGLSAVNMLKMTRILTDFSIKLRTMKSSKASTFAMDGSVANVSSYSLTGDSLGYPTTQEYAANNQTTLCTRQEIIHGAWSPIQKLRPPYIPRNEHLRCYSEEAYTETPWDTYQWQPESTTCKFSEWNSTDFCSVMSFGTILIAGDSLSWEQYSSLGQLLGLRIRQSSQWDSKENQENHIQFGCNRQTRLVFRRDDLLTNLTGAIKEAFPQVIVINRGAHYQSDSALVSGIHQNIKDIKEWKEKCNDYGLKCHLFWRTSVPGHPLCSQTNFTQPINDLAEMETWIGNRSNYNEHTIKYHWYDYQHQNNLALDILRQGLGDDSFEVLDAYYLNVLRPDEHRAQKGDCLHNCYPGKMDVYNQLLLHYLRVQRTQGDVDYLTYLFAEAHADTMASNNATQGTQLL